MSTPFELEGAAPLVPRSFVLTATMLAIGVAVAVFWRGLKAPRTRPAAELGMLAAFAAAGLAVAAVLFEERAWLVRAAPAAAALLAGLAHAVAFGYAPLPPGWRPSRAVTGRVGLACGALVALALAAPASPWLRALGAAAAVVALVLWVRAGRARSAPERVLRGETWLPSVRFPCPRCGVVADWPDAVTACPACGLFVHLVWDPDGGEPARFAPEDPAPGTFRRFRCLGCRNEVDWMRGTTACAVCGRRLRLHWNVHA